MSSQLPPNPILTTYQYWNWKPVDEATRRQRALDNTYITFPTVQNYPTFFSKLFLITDAVLTKMANTSYVYSLIQSLLDATTWTGSNQFNSIKVNTLADMTLNDADFAGTTTLTNSTFNTPLTPNYAYSATTGTGTGKIGEIAPVTTLSNTTGEGTAGAGVSLRSVSLTKGVWLVAGTARMTGTADRSAITIGTVINNTTLPIYGRKGTWIYSAGQPFKPFGVATIATVYIDPIFPATTITLYLSVRNNPAIAVNFADFKCIRIG